ncbi:hypothetical protein N836_17045 [Leptolyngbya sp. Heron Island J]|uniref:hypothetical protein n=1 Tax=Leptolyngbya sp. Heron Island J TaxID=1385935 RepID=UPI0003B96AF9|nr:hypothetical protein [Leptolyngbya sp. Heron Island J]ESA34335.1 hypothetical protein N836_17045 [Leptolyngbya sp. Heron Island J]
MDNRKLRQSAADDFVKSLEHLDELLGDTAEALVLEDEPQASDANGPDTIPQALSSSNKTQTPYRQSRR